MVGQAIEKLDREYQSGKYDKYAAIMKMKILAVLKKFCHQEEEFAQAIVQGGTFEDCMKAVAKNPGNGIADEEAYGRAVQFYFPTAAVHVQVTIDLAPHDKEDEPENSGHRAVVLNLADFLM